MTAKTGTTRIVGIDVARSCAIFLAMASHVWADCQMKDFFEGPGVDALKLSMALATPTFIVLFGTMLEVVYLPRFVAPKRGVQVARLWSRAIQCWLLYSLSVVVLFFFRSEYSLMFSLSTILMLGVTPFTDILKFYAFALTIAPVLLWPASGWDLRHFCFSRLAFISCILSCAGCRALRISACQRNSTGWRCSFSASATQSLAGHPCSTA